MLSVQFGAVQSSPASGSSFSVLSLLWSFSVADKLDFSSVQALVSSLYLGNNQFAFSLG